MTRRPRLALRTRLLLVLLLAALALGGFGALWAFRKVQRLNALAAAVEADFRTANAGLFSPTAGTSTAVLARARANLRELQAELRPVIAIGRLASQAPLVGPRAQSITALLDMATDFAAAGERLALAAEPLVAQPAAASDETPIAVLARRLDQARGELATVQAYLTRATAERQRIDRAHLDGPLDRLGKALDRLDTEVPKLQAGLQLAATLPDLVSRLAGFDRPRTYLVLGQNSDELRATGGFIGTVGVVTLDRGVLRRAEFKSSYDIDNAGRAWVPPPEPLSDYMGIWLWQLRDANWSPDFPTAAAEVARFWAMDVGDKVDGVVALDEEALRLIVEALGPIDLPRYNETITAANLRTRTLYYLYNQPGGHRQRHTQFSSELSAALLRRLFSLGGSQLLALYPALQRAAAERHLLVSLNDQQLAQIARQANWDGRLVEREGDYLAIIDSNVSYSKLTPFVEQALQYEVQLDAAGRPARAMLTITYRNTYRLGQRTAYPDDYLKGGRWNSATRQIDFAEGYYGDYVRVYVPKGSQFLGASGFRDPVRFSVERDKAVLGSFLWIGPGEEKRVKLEWTPPARVTLPNGAYRLTVQKQAGTQGHRLEVQVTAPPLANGALRPVPAATAAGTSLRWQTDLSVDREFLLAPAGSE